MLGRLLLGMVKGLVVGGLLGLALVKLGMAVPVAIVAYLAAAVVGVVIGLVAGKPIWAKDAKIEAGVKAAVGAIAGVLLMAAARQWAMVALPFSVGELAPTGAVVTFGGWAMSSLAAIAALLGGFYDADNDDTGGEDATPKSAEKGKAAAPNKRIAQAESEGEEDEEIAAESEKKRARK